MTWLSQEKRRTTVCSAGLVLLLLAAPSLLLGQRDSIPPGNSDPDRVFIDAAAIVRAGGVQSLADVLNSRVPGLLVTSGSGLNGAGSRIRFAGLRSIFSDGAPLILLDGIRVDATADGSSFDLGGPGPLRLDDFNVEDIESIEVISNPAAAMIHGPGAADGVISIRTKRGRSGPLQLGGYGTGWLETVTTRWPANYRGVDVDNLTPFFRDECTLQFQAAGQCQQDYIQSFNPLTQRSPFTTAVRHHLGLHATGGPEWGAFRLGAGLDGTGGVYDVPLVTNPDASRRWNITGSGTLRPHRRIDIGFMLTRISGNLYLPMYGPISSALRGPSDSLGFTWAPLFNGTPRERLDRTTGVAEAQIRPVRWLTGRLLLGLEDVEQYSKQVLTDVVAGRRRTEARRDIENSTSAVSLSATGPSRHGFRARTTVGWERAQRRRNEDVRTGSDTGDFCGTFCVSQAINMPRRYTGAYIVEDITIRERLAITAALRYDKFGQQDVLSKKSQYNPLLRLSWVASSGRSGVLSGLRLYAAYGSAGGAGAPDAVSFVILPPFTPVPDVERRPDRVTSMVAGADAQVLDRWDARVRLYDLRSNVMQDIPISFPGAPPLETFGSDARISNRGIVASVGGPLIARDELRWDVRLSVWGNRNRLRALAFPGRRFFSDAALGHRQGLVVGYPTGGYWGYRLASFGDANADGIIELSELVLDPEPTWAGTPYPTQGAALQTSLRLGNGVRLNTTLDYRGGHVLFNRNAWARCFLRVCRDRNDPGTSLERQAIAVSPLTGAAALPFFEDADYLKLRELQVSFDLPASTARRLGAREATIGLAIRNLLTWTRYSGGDPESGSYGSAAPADPMLVADFGVVPVARSIAVQVRVSY